MKINEHARRGFEKLGVCENAKRAAETLDSIMRPVEAQNIFDSITHKIEGHFCIQTWFGMKNAKQVFRKKTYKLFNETLVFHVLTKKPAC